MIEAGLPNVTGNCYNLMGNPGSASGALNSSHNNIKGSAQEGSGNLGWRNFDFNASWSNSIYGASDTVQPPALNLIPQIRF